MQYTANSYLPSYLLKNLRYNLQLIRKMHFEFKKREVKVKIAKFEGESKKIGIFAIFNLNFKFEKL